MSPAALEHLGRLRAELDSLKPEMYPFDGLVNWIKRAMPIVKQHFPTFFDEFKSIAKPPQATGLPMVITFNKARDDAESARLRGMEKATDEHNFKRAITRIANHVDAIIAAASIETVGVRAEEVRKPDGSNVHFGPIHNSAIMLHSPGATQSLTFSQTNKSNAVDLVAAVRQALNKMELSDETKEELLSHLDYAETQLKKDSPKTSVIKAAFEGVHDGLIEVSKTGASTATVAVATGLAQQVWHFVSGLLS